MVAKQISLEESEQILGHQRLYPCRQCDRKFNEKALEKHQNVCKIVFGTKRSEFDSQHQRLGGKVPISLLSNGTQPTNKERVRGGSVPKQHQRDLNPNPSSQQQTQRTYGSIKPDKDGMYTVIQQGKKV